MKWPVVRSAMQPTVPHRLRLWARGRGEGSSRWRGCLERSDAASLAVRRLARLWLVTVCGLWTGLALPHLAAGQVLTPQLAITPADAKARALLTELESVESLARASGRGEGFLSFGPERLAELSELLLGGVGSGLALRVVGERDGVVETLQGRLRQLVDRGGWPVGSPATQAWELEQLRRWEAVRDAMADPTQLARWATAHGPGRAAGEAVARAALRWYHRGDDSAAWLLGQRARRLEVELSWPGPPPAPPTAAPASAARGRWVTSAWWFDKRPDRLGGIRVPPVSLSERRVVWVGRYQAVCLELVGGGVSGADANLAARVVWASPPTDTPRPASGPRLPGRLSFPVYGGAAGSGVVVVRQPGASGAAVLRALDADEGRLLWSTETSARLSGVHVASLPAVAGGIVYGVIWERAADAGHGVQPGDPAGESPVVTRLPTPRGRPRGAGVLSVVAIELSTGRLFWRTPLGAVSDLAAAGRGADRVESLEMRESPPLWDDLAAPAVGDDRLAVAAGGMLIVLDRFDGSVLGGVRYPSVGVVAREGEGPGFAPMSRWGAAVVFCSEKVSPEAREDGSSDDGHASSGSAGVWVVAGRDTDGVLAFDAISLRPRWKQARWQAFTLVGTTPDGSGVVLQGDELVCLSAASGGLRWSLAPRTQTRWTGPAGVYVVARRSSGRGDLPREVGVVAVPTTRGVAAASIDDGTWLEAAAVWPVDLAALVRGPVAGALLKAGVLEGVFSLGALDELLGVGERGGGAERGIGPPRVVPPPGQPPRPMPRGPIPPPRVEPKRSGG